MRKSTIVKLKQEIERATRLGKMDDVRDNTQRLKDIRRLWRKLGEDPLVKHMKEIVDVVVEHYEMDFYYHDLMMMDNSTATFLWYTYESGTDLIWLEGSEKRMESQKDCFNVVRTTKSDGITIDPRHHMYIVDRKIGEIKEITKFHDVKFEVVADETQLYINNAS
ncbi:hypothetical protein [Paenibacillus periandrae]|uniref:hypothetical protein n=1 Tax=Paenibacillus periandrae TaxID=1761741 RepID=UPI001F09BB1E|nr:hypothetical protein [Paenibacillus periandrae]